MTIFKFITTYKIIRTPTLIKHTYFTTFFYYILSFKKIMIHKNVEFNYFNLQAFRDKTKNCRLFCNFFPVNRD